MPDKPDKYQEEIEELLRGMGETKPSGNKRDMEPPPDDAPIVPNQPPQQVANRRPTWSFPSVSPAKLAMIGIMTLILGAFWIRPLIWVGMGFLLGAYLLYFVKPRSISNEKRWRGQVVEEEPKSWDKLRRWFKM